jgi:hypothetical protein
MRRFSLPFACTVVLALGVAPAARADFIHWSYNWTPNTPAVFSDNKAAKITLTNEPGADAVGDSDIVATNLRTFSTADPSKPDVFTGAAYKLTLTLIDEESRESASLTFEGVFTGTLSAKSANIDTLFVGQANHKVVLGGNAYTVEIGTYSPPPPPNATNAGSIGAIATVRVDGIKDVPEPAALALAGVGLGLAALARYRRRRRRG